MKNLFTYLLLLPAILLASCTKLSTAHSDHLMIDDIPLGQHINDFYKAFAEEWDWSDMNITWSLEVSGDKAYFNWESTEDDSNGSFMADLYNDTIYCFYRAHDYACPVEDIQVYLANCDTIFANNSDYIFCRSYLPGGYIDYIFEPESHVIAHVDSLGLARYHELHKQ